MKIFICLLATVCACNATFSSLLGGIGGGSGGSRGGSHVTYNVVATPTHIGGHGNNHGHGHNHGYGHSHGGSPQVIQLILDQGHGGGNGISGGYGYGGGDHGYHGGASAGGEVQLFKVITHSSAGLAPIHVEHGYSAGDPHASGYAHGGSHSVNSQLNAILPQILQIILQDDAFHGFGGGDDLNSQLISHFGQHGKTVITRSNGKTNSFFSGGHVVQKGVLKVMRVKETRGAAHPASANGPPSRGHGW